MRTVAVPHLQSTLSLWYLHSNSELQQDGDTGGTIASEQSSNRYGIEWANYYTPDGHLAFDFDIANSRAQFTQIDPGMRHITNQGGGLYPSSPGWQAGARSGEGGDFVGRSHCTITKAFRRLYACATSARAI